MSSRYEEISIPTYQPGLEQKYPVFFENREYQGASGRVYPLPYTSAISDVKQDKKYRAAVLENQWIKVTVLPEIGGKVFRALDKKTNYDFVYYNPVIKPAMIGLAGPWISGGIEFNFPQHHRPTTFMPVESRLTADGVELHETDPMENLQSSLVLRVPEDHAYLQAEVTVFNPTQKARPFMWWSNLAVEINQNYQIVFPPDVEYVNDHDRRDLMTWPIARGVQQSARPYDFGTQGVDIHHVFNIEAQSSYMVSKGETEYDFVSGWDQGVKCGTVSVSDHSIATGKKVFTWGQHPFGWNWCRNLTDNGSQYCELMTGVYTDNQPDFTWILPQEEIHFTQYWYPISQIGEVVKATKDLAVSVHLEAGKLSIAAMGTSEMKDCTVAVESGGKQVFSQKADFAPESCFSACVASSAIVDSTYRLTICNAQGRIIMDYIPPVRGVKKPQKMRDVPKDPSAISSVEELYLNGRHLEQYKHFNRNPEPFYREALKRDPGESRCNTAMGNRLLERGQFEEALSYFDNAIERLELRNANPENVEPYYRKGCALLLLGRDQEAVKCFERSCWADSYRNASFYALAKLCLKHKDTDRAEQYLSLCRSQSGKALQRVLAGNPQPEDSFTAYPQGTVQERLFTARELLESGMVEKAEALLRQNQEDSLSLYYLYWLTGQKEYMEKADTLPCRPWDLRDIQVLRAAGSAPALYALGCLYYGRENYEQAASLWKESLKLDPSESGALYGLSHYYVRHKNDPYTAISYMQKAFDISEDPVLLSDLCQLYQAAGKSAEERLAFHRKYQKPASCRDDVVSDYAQCLEELGKYKEALDLLASHRFHSYEGGEGSLTNLHMRLVTEYGRKLLEEGNTSQAIELLSHGTEMPENYGEVNSYSSSPESVFYTLGCAYEADGQNEKAQEAFSKACSDPCAPSPESYYRVLAYWKTGKAQQARELIEQMRSQAESMLADESLPYFGVGAPIQSLFGPSILALRKKKAAAILEAAARAEEQIS